MKTKLTGIITALSLMASLFTITAHADNERVTYGAFTFDKTEGAIVECDKSVSGVVEVPEKIDGVTVKIIGARAFEECTELTGVKLPDTIEEIQTSAFVLSSIESIELPPKTTTVESQTFWECTKLTDVKLHDNITKIEDYAFFGCSALESVEIPASVTEIQDGAFAWCGKLRINVDEQNPDYTDVDGALFNKDKTKILAYSNDINEPEYKIPDGVTEIADYAFNWEEGLKKVYIPNGVTKIGKEAFDQCKSLEELVFPNGVTEIGERAFHECDALKTVYLPESLKVIGASAFSYSLGITDVYYGGSEESWNNIDFTWQNYMMERAQKHYNYTLAEASEPEITDGTLKYDVFLRIGNDEGLKKTMLHAAQYDDQGVLTAVHFGAKSEVKDGKMTITAAMPSSPKYKIMLWDINLRPLADVVSSR